MNTVYLMAGGLAGDPARFRADPRYRKATRNMILATDSVEKALARFDSATVLSDCGYVLGTCHGELETTIHFLSTLSTTGVARPIFFQNSLHNSTTGFVCMHWKITGPMLTVSRLQFTGEDALSTAWLLIRRGQCGACLVTGVDASVPELVEGLKDTHLRNHYAGEGAATVLLANREAARRLGRVPLAELCSVSTFEGEATSLEVRAEGYESDAIQQLVSQLPNLPSELRLTKPTGGHSLILCQPFTSL